MTVPQLPDDAVEHLRQILDDSESHQWRCGDLLADLIDEFLPTFEAAYGRRGRAMIIRQLANRLGRDESTLRDRLSICLFYPPRVRSEYDELTWSQLRACKSAGPDWKIYADWAMENLPAPTSMIRARIKGNGDQRDNWEELWDRLLELVDKLLKMEIPEWVRTKLRGL